MAGVAIAGLSRHGFDLRAGQTFLTCVGALSEVGGH